MRFYSNDAFEDSSAESDEDETQVMPLPQRDVLSVFHSVVHLAAGSLKQQQQRQQQGGLQVCASGGQGQDVGPVQAGEDHTRVDCTSADFYSLVRPKMRASLLRRSTRGSSSAVPSASKS